MAGNSSAIRAGRAFVELFADDSKLVKNMATAEQKVRAFGTKIGDIGKTMFQQSAAISGLFLLAIHQFTSAGESLLELSQKTGISVEALSELRFAAKQSGLEIEEFEVAMKSMNKFTVQAALGAAEARQSLARMGLTAEQLAKSAPEEQFRLFADAIDSVANPSLKVALALQVFGRTGEQMLPLLEKGAAGIEKLRKTAREFGLQISTKDAIAADTLGDAIELLWFQVRAAAFQIGSALGGSLNEVVENFQKALKSVIAWIKENKALVLLAAKMTLIFGAAGLALVAVGAAINGVAAILGAMIATITTVASVFGTLLTVLGVILTPMGLVTAGLVAIAVKSGLAGKAVRAALGTLGEVFKTLQADAELAFAGIRDALMAGDFAAAANIAWLAIKLEFMRGTNALSTVWFDFSKFFLDVWANAVGELAGEFLNASAVIQGAWVTLLTGWQLIVNDLANIWEQFAVGCVKAFNAAWAAIKTLVLANVTFMQAAIDSITGGAHFIGPGKAKILADFKQINADLEAAQEEANKTALFSRKQREEAQLKIVAAARAKLDKLLADRDASLKAIRDDVLGKEDASAAGRDSAIAAAQKELDAAKAALAAAVADSARARSPSARDAAQAAVAKAAAGVAAIPLAPSGAAGTFNPFGIGGLGFNPLLAESKKQTGIQRAMQKRLDERVKLILFGAVPG